MTQKKETFGDRFDGISDILKEQNIETPYGNVIGMIMLDRMVDEVIITDELQKIFHEYFGKIIQGIYNTEMEPISTPPSEDEILNLYT